MQSDQILSSTKALMLLICEKQQQPDAQLNPTAHRMDKTLMGFGHFDCDRDPTALCNC